MSQIPGFSLAALGTNASQQSQQSLPPNLNMLTAQQQALLAQHQQHQQRQQQSSPPQPQSLPGVTNPDNQRMWQAIDQQVRAHNDATTANPTYNQVSKFFFFLHVLYSFFYCMIALLVFMCNRRFSHSWAIGVCLRHFSHACRSILAFGRSHIVLILPSFPLSDHFTLDGGFSSRWWSVPVTAHSAAKAARFLSIAAPNSDFKRGF